MIELPIWVVLLWLLSMVANVWTTNRHIQKTASLLEILMIAQRVLHKAHAVLTETGRGKVSEDVLVLVEDVIKNGLDEIDRRSNK